MLKKFRRVKQIDTKEGKAFVFHTDSVYDAMEKWLKNRSRICLKLRSANANESNRFLEVIFKKIVC